ncbi:MAG: YraN family protein [Candidatus Solibacter usitatus]|nr:YraN family protein [Candidatus Solibacter usitatus]
MLRGARKGDVKTRASNEFGEPDRAVNEEKRKRLRIAARDYARRAGVPWEKCRFDIVSIVLGRRDGIQLMADAFSKERHAPAAL